MCAAYVKRNKTDAADALALLEAARASDIKPVAVKSIEQQGLQALHRMRSGWMASRTRRINTLRGFCREFGLVVPEGAARGLAQIARYLADEHSGLPGMLRASMRLMVEEVRLLEARIGQLERELSAIARQSPACEVLVSVPGIGLLTSTAMVAAVGDPRSFAASRRYSSFLGLTPREFSSGNQRYLGRISKRGDRYIRMLLTHGARSVLRAATVAQRTGRNLDPLRSWALAVQARTNHNKATCALANKLARIAWAVWVKQEKYRSAQAPIEVPST
jgi:transposase